jgi:hypothetical protein
MDEKIYEERLNKIITYCKTLNNAVYYKEVAIAVNMSPEVVHATISIYVTRFQKGLEKNPALAMNGPTEEMEILVYKIKELKKARFYIEGLKQRVKIAQAGQNIKNKVSGLFKKGGE